MSRNIDLIAVIEAAHRLEADNQTWLDALAHAIRPLFDRGGGLIALVVDGAKAVPESAEVLAVAGLNVSERAVAAAEMMRQSATTEEMRRRFVAAGPVGTVRHTLGARAPEWAAQYARHGTVDSIYMLAGDPRGLVCVLSSPRERIARISRQHRVTLEHVSAHVAAALALRTRAGSPVSGEAQAILDPRGNVCEAKGNAKSAWARLALREGVLASEKARGSLRRTAAEEALMLWRARVGAQWSLSDQLERDGRRFVAARRNDPWRPRALLLSTREWQVASLAAQGHSNKLVAYELGIALETVATHLTRARAKLGASSRLELARLMFQGLTSPPHSSHGSEQMPDRSALARLSPSEREITEMLLEGRTQRQVATQRETSQRTIANQVASIFRKLSVRSRSELLALLLLQARERSHVGRRGAAP